MITADYLRSILHYDKDTGEFTWLKSRGTMKGGSVAGGLCDGYINIKINRKLYKAHRLAWLYMTSEWPSEIDHGDGVPSHNWFSNLRIATRSQNTANRKLAVNSTSGYKGVHQVGDRFRAYVSFNRKRVNLGRFATAEEAHAAYVKAANELHGEFARAA